MKDLKLAADRGIDVTDRRLALKIAAERLSIVRYVFMVQIEDGIATATERATLEYADAVLIGWPEHDAAEVRDLGDEEYETVTRLMDIMEGHIHVFSRQEAAGNIDPMTDILERVTDCVAQIRRLYQPDFPLPTFAEISRVVQEEWDEDMGKIDSQDIEPTVETFEEQTEHADEQRERQKANDAGGANTASGMDGAAR
ncbi:phosphoribosylglycinamide synthetase [Bifidobacterium mongoliense]|uniref:phosphoribosylglycinamide synthetase n=1 Tax=Bifidobacterium mongoliense TaxID=518643 RepID=UPI0030ED289B